MASTGSVPADEHATVLLSQGETPGQGVGHKHRICARQFGELQNTQADATGTENRDPVPDSDAGEVDGVQGDA
ncbi:hypothetical protein C2W62_22030 [Candidatus Entotheonella serta]|nr:hypothetical protein C2W62_22030 [Candidatus Entotheonella serta]